jgi:hypothetical protein
VAYVYRSCLASSPDSKPDLSEGPIFRVAEQDNLSRPLFSKTVESLHALLIQAVERCNAALLQELHFTPRPDRHVYGMPASQFFGLSQPFVLQAIERTPEAIACMVNAEKGNSRYLPRFRLPGDPEINYSLQLLANAGFSVRASVYGCSRADPTDNSSFSLPRFTRILTKIADVLDGMDAEGSSVAEDMDNTYNTRELEKEESRVEMKARADRYLEMTEDYRRNPNAKIEVRKSRIHNWGLFTKINFEKDEILVEYIGEQIRQVVADKREALYENEGVGSCYLFR